MKLLSIIRCFCGIALLGCAVREAAGQELAEATTPEFFETRVRPVLAGTCFACHGGRETKGGLRVDSREALVAGGSGGPAVEAGDVEASLLLQAIRYDDPLLKMPPGGKLDARSIEAIEAWVKAGAPWPESVSREAFQAKEHWAFVPVSEPKVPSDGAGWAANAIDRFVAAGWRERGVSPVGEADRRTLIRRLSFDLTGLPPTAEEVDTFVADSREDAWERLVERLLSSPAYGERWGRHWLDLARYADTAGDNADYPVPEAARYRDYVIEGFNADLPYDQFVREQIAGDLLAGSSEGSRYAEQVAATGFLALSRRYATGPYELWHLSLEDAIDATGRAFLGMTMRCARCHDHKFDPIATTDYYALYGVFASTKFPYAGSEEFQSKQLPRKDFAALEPAANAGPKWAAHERLKAELDAEIRAIEARKPEAGSAEAKQRAALATRLAVLTKRGAPEDLTIGYAVGEGSPVDAAVQIGGEPGKPGAVVPRGAPTFLKTHPAPSIPPGESGRRQVAEWLTDQSNPLAARVMVNRIWQHHFGRGLVATPSDFGVQGAHPTHPELLDWLAARFVESGWSIKAMHRQIVGSNTYRLASTDSESNQAIDPDNAFLWRYSRRRLDAEAIRDAMLAVSGHLDRSRPTESPFPPIEAWRWTQHTPFQEVYATNRRTVYMMTQRLQKHPFLALFDGPDTNTSTERRADSTVPLQSLFLMNNPWVREQAEGLAARVMEEPGDPMAKVVRAYRLVLGREPTEGEMVLTHGHLVRLEREFRRFVKDESVVKRMAWASLAKIMITSNEFLYVD